MHLALRSTLIACLTFGTASAAFADYPEKPIRIVIPFAAGGGSDVLARALQASIERNDVLPVPIVVNAIPGAGTTIGSREVSQAEPDGYTYLLSHFALLSGIATGIADYALDDFTPVAQISRVCLAYAVMEDSEYQSFDQLIQDVRANPGEVREAINIGAVVHVTSWMMGDAAGGLDFRYVQTGGGAKRFEALLSEQVDTAQFSNAELAIYIPQGVRPLVIMSDERNPNYPDLPTAQELGIPVTACVKDTFFAPAGTDPARNAIFVDALEAAIADPQFQSFMASNTREIDFIRGTALQDAVDAEFAAIAEAVGGHLDELQR